MRILRHHTSVALASLLAMGQSFQTTPVMGFNSYNQMACSPTEALITTAIDSMASLGFVTAGYKYFQVDCGWASRNGERNSSTGALAIDTDAFPNGLASLSSLAISKGMIWSMYSDAGLRMCDTTVPSPVLGSLGHETVDAAFFKSLNTEYLKYDNCYANGTTSDDNAPKDPRTDFVTRYTAMWDALQNEGISGMMVCEWGVPYSTSSGLEGPDQWTKGIATSFRLSDDIGEGWDNVYRIYNQAVHIAKSGNIGPGHVADADLLEVGNAGMTYDEQATHFAFWAMVKSALMISTNLEDLASEYIKLLQNADLIAINQDSAVEPIQLVQRWTDDRDLWAGDLANGDMAVLMVDLTNTSRTLTLPFSELGITSATVLDIWTGTTTSGASTYSKAINAHGSMALRLSNIKKSTSTTTYKYTSATTGTLSNGAVVQSCSGCSNGENVGYLGGSEDGKLVLSGITTTEASQNVLFDYINCDVDYGGGGSNERLASISVNEGAAVTVSFPMTGYNWVEDIYKSYPVALSGFSTTGTNTITISGSGTGYAPDLDRIGVVT
ncbi:glycoside hydrolase superfamily [Xylariaceae sp. FL0255]|nr:glycoside hydrolase superfamily [Xylariaceae sp. FL0255]